MCYVIFMNSMLVQDLIEEANKSSYRALSERFKLEYPQAKMSPSKLWRIASKKSNVSAKELAQFANVFNVKIDRYFVETPF